MRSHELITRGLVAMLLLSLGAQAFAARTTTYLHNDGLGSVVAATNQAGAVLWRKDYAPFGEQIDSTPDSERTAYTGKQHDDAIGLTYFGGRHFDPELGRFTSVDPVAFTEQNAMSFNRYLYVNNNPYKYVDPDGEFLTYVAKFVIDVGINVALNYVTTGEANLKGALKESVIGLINPIPGKNAGKLLMALGKASKKAPDPGAATGILANKASGDAFARKAIASLKETQSGVVQEVTVRTKSGVRTRLDALGRDASSAVRCSECKGSAAARLTTNQTKAFPEIEKSGAVVVGKGKPGFPGGTVIPPTKVDIIRP